MIRTGTIGSDFKGRPMQLLKSYRFLHEAEAVLLLLGQEGVAAKLTQGHDALAGIFQDNFHIEVPKDQIELALDILDGEHIVEKIDYTIRVGLLDDLPTVLEMIHELAEFEDLKDQVSATLDDFQTHFFGHAPVAHLLIAESDNQIIAYAIYFKNFSTFLGKPGFHLEDIYVTPIYRKQGIATALIKSIAKEAKEKGYGRVEWDALDWNTTAHRVYENLGAKTLDDWISFRLTSSDLDQLSKE